MLLELSRQFLSGEGDVTKHLGYLGYTVTYEQVSGIKCKNTTRHVVCCVGDFKGQTVHTFVMCAHFPDVRTLHLMLHCG